MEISRYRTWEFETGHAFIFVERSRWIGLSRGEREIERRALVSRKYFLRVKASGSPICRRNSPSQYCMLYVVAIASQGKRDDFKLSFNRSVGENSITNFLPKGSLDEIGKLFNAIFPLREFSSLLFYVILFTWHWAVRFYHSKFYHQISDTEINGNGVNSESTPSNYCPV